MYCLTEEMTQKPTKELALDNPLTEAQKTEYAAVLREASARLDRGVGAIWSRAAGGQRPAAIYCEGVISLETAAEEFAAIHRANPKVQEPVTHLAFSLSGAETKSVSTETLIQAANATLNRAGWAGHARVLICHEDTDNKHIHAVLSTVNRETLRAHPKHGRIGRLHKATREIEKEFGLAADFGIWHRRSDGEIVKTARLDFEAWKRQKGDDRGEELARSFPSDNEGLESSQDRADRVVHALRSYFEQCDQRRETPLRSEVHRLAAQLTATVENGPRGEFRVRIMEKAEPGMVRSSWVDYMGEVHKRMAHWKPTNDVFTIPLTDLAPEAYGTEVPTALPAWLRSIGDLDAAAEETLAHLSRDPGRISRDLVASGLALFSLDDMDKWASERITWGWMEASDAARLADTTIVIRSPDTAHPLLSTREQVALEQRVSDRVRRLATKKDMRFNRAALDRAIAEEEKASGLVLSDEQRACFELLEYGFGLIQGEAGAGKSSIMAVVRRYCELTSREIVGFATSQRAAEKLGQSAGIHSVNTALAQVLESARGEVMVPASAVSIIDETSCVSFESLDALLARVEQQGGIALAIGDAAQLENLAAGNAMRVLRAAAGSQVREVTQVYRQRGTDVEWMREAVRLGGKAIRDGDADGFRAYLKEFVERGHIVFYDNRQEEVRGKAQDIADATRRGLRVIAPAAAHTDCLHVNRAVREELGLKGAGIDFKFKRGWREIAAGDRVQFCRNSTKLDVVNGFLATVRSVQERKIIVQLDGGGMRMFDPSKYKFVDYGWSTTTMKSQGQGDPIALPTLSKSDNARSFHVAVTRCQTDLKCHTRLSAKELEQRLTSDASVAPKSDALLFEDLVNRVGGPNTIWARTVRRAMESDRDPLHIEWRSEMHARTAAYERRITELFEDPSLSDRQRRVARTEAAKQYEVIPFSNWAYQRRRDIEGAAERQEQRQRHRSELGETTERQRLRHEILETQRIAMATGAISVDAEAPLIGYLERDGQRRPVIALYGPGTCVQLAGVATEDGRLRILVADELHAEIRTGSLKLEPGMQLAEEHQKARTRELAPEQSRGMGIGR